MPRAIACLLLVCCLVGCGNAPAFSREQALARGIQSALESAPEVGIIQARIDRASAELITLRDADARVGGGRGPGGYAPGQTPDSPVWWVSVRGYFRYEGMAAAPSTAPVCEADERDFIYDARTGEEVSGPIPNTRCATGVGPTPSTTPGPPSRAVIATLAPADNGYPPWVGTPATGLHPRSDQSLPAGIANGDIIESSNLLWFIWENTKSRIWFPNGEAYLNLFQQGPDRTRRLVGVTTVPEQWEIVFRKVLNQNQIQQVYLADRTSHIMYPLKHQVMPWDQAQKIPTAIGDQYYPILADN